MPKNPEYTKAIGEWKASPDLIASMNSEKENNPRETNTLFKLLFNQEKINTALEKEIVTSQFFADLFDANTIKWSVMLNDKKQFKITKVLKKYLEKTDFAIKLWQTKFKAGMYGRYGIVISKEKIGTDKNGDPLTRPNFIPVLVNWKNSINGKIFEVEVEFQDYSFSNGKSLFNLKRTYSLLDNKITIDSTLINTDSRKEALSTEINEILKNNVNLAQENLNWNFIPVSVLSNNIDDIPRTSIVKSRMMILDRYDEIIAILPAWEKGAILHNAPSVTPENQDKQNEQLMKNILLKGHNQFKTMEVDGNIINLAENIVIFKPNSIMQTTKATRDLIWMDAKEDLGLPSLNDVKSAQKTAAEVVAKQFLTSPIIEREKVFMKSFLKDLAKKFLIILSECNIPEKTDFPSNINWDEVNIEVEFDITTDKNVNRTVQEIKSNQPINDESTEDEDDEPREKPGFFRKIFRRK